MAIKIEVAVTEAISDAQSAETDCNCIQHLNAAA